MLIDEYVKARECLIDDTINYRLIQQYNAIKEDELEIKISRLFKGTQQSLNNSNSIIAKRINEIEKYKKIYDQYVESLTELSEISTIKSFLQKKNFDYDEYIKQTKDLHNILSVQFLNSIKEKNDKNQMILERVNNIVNRFNLKISNNEKIVNDFATAFTQYIKKVCTIYKTIQSIYKEIDTLNSESLVNREVFSFGYDNNKLNVRVETKMNIKEITDEESQSIFANYNKINDYDGMLHNTLLTHDYGDYYIQNVFEKKDKRKNSNSLMKPRLEKTIYLKTNNDDEKNWSELSPGERSNMLLNIVLLNDCSKILLIDQPEDDLDNETIYNKIVNRIRELKLKRQIIIVTHNANIAITGDSDYLTICESKDDGTYDLINDTMESERKYDYYSINNVENKERKIIDIAALILDGGKEALSRRVRKIGYKGLFLDKEE